MNPQDENLQNDGIRKAAVLVAGLDRTAADAMLDQLTPEQARLVRQAMVDLGEIDPGEQRRVIDEFFRIGPTTPTLATPTPAVPKPLVPEKEPPGIELDGSLARRMAASQPAFSPEKPFETRAADAQPFRFLHETEAEKLARALAGERPQTIALVLAHLPPEQAGGVLLRLPARVQVNVIQRLVDLEETDPQVLRDIERVLESRLSQQVCMQRRRVAGLGAVTDILKASGGRAGTEILENLAEHDPSLAERLSPQKIDFDDLMQLDDKALEAVFDAAGPELAITALIGASPSLIERVLGRLPATEAAALRRRLDHPGPIRLSDMEDARQQIAQTAGRLAVEGDIELTHPKPPHAA